MITFLNPVVLPIIGQFAADASPLLKNLAELRAPAFLPSSINAILFENQPLLWISAGAAVLILLHLARSRASRNFAIAAVVTTVITLLWILIAQLVVTPSERLYNAHQTLSTAAKNNDIPTILTFLGPDFESTPLNIQNRADAAAQIEARLKSYGIKSNSITAYHADIFPPSATTKLTLITQSASFTVKTTWELWWEDLPNQDWKIQRADLLSVNDNPAHTLSQ